jgi:molybdenum cofactor cytidylyltransferase
MILSLMQAIRASNSSIIAFAGSGGKTTAMFQLARELGKSFPVLVTASSHLGAWQVPLADEHLIVSSKEDLSVLGSELAGITLVTDEPDGDRTKPLNAETLNQLNEFCIHRSIPLLIEADGSRQKPLKAWAEHEPPIPPFVRQVVHVVGLAGIGKPLSDEVAHRSRIFSELSGLHLGEIITPEAVAHVLLDAKGGQKNIPSSLTRKTVLLNQADTPELQSAAQRMTGILLQGFHSVVIANLKRGEVFAVHEPAAGIILAAGESRRFGQPKQLLDWKGQPFVRVVAKTAREAGLDPVIVVTGANRESVEATVRDLNVRVVQNENWSSGQGSSIRKAVRVLNAEYNVGAAIFLLVDQPQVTKSILQALVERHAAGLYPVVAPMVIDQRANPVLFDQATFPDLMELEGDVGGRAIFHKHHIEYLPWHDDRLLLDVDTPEQYQRLISDETL